MTSELVLSWVVCLQVPVDLVCLRRLLDVPLPLHQPPVQQARPQPWTQVPQRSQALAFAQGQLLICKVQRKTDNEHIMTLVNATN